MYEKVIELIERKQRFLVTGHELPDGDCVGAEAALYHLLRSMGKDATVVNSDPIPRNLDFLARHTPYSVWRPGTRLDGFDVHFLVDCHQLARLGALAGALPAAGRDKPDRVVVDHHVGALRGDGDQFLVDETAPATGVLVYDLIRKVGAPLPIEAAEGIFVSLVTDTGWFRFANTDDNCLAIAADLVARGVDLGGIHDLLYRRNPPEGPALLARAISAARFEAGQRIAIAALDAAFMAEAERVGFDVEEVLEPLRSVRGVEVVMLLKEKSAGRVRVSLRSRARVEVDGVARSLGGGGHKRAAGAEVVAPLARVEAQLLEMVRPLVEAVS